MAKKKRGDAHGGGHGWFVTFADLMGLMMSFFVMLVAFSTQDQAKLKIVAGSMRDAQSAFDQVISFAGEKIKTEDVEKALGIAGAYSFCAPGREG